MGLVWGLGNTHSIWIKCKGNKGKKSGKREENMLQGARCVGQSTGGVGKAEKGTFAECHSFVSSSVAWYHFLQPGKGAEGRES